MKKGCVLLEWRVGEGNRGWRQLGTGRVGVRRIIGIVGSGM